jgi:hypothetical protein|tara:strand:+ start:1358 stop:1786 length:429 start_codon:yes stop_codon:yes gene_type:complete
MIIISHRGNINGPNPRMENKPEYIKKALDENFMVEIDVWFYQGELWLGHDEPQYETNLDFLKQDLLICHAKNCESLEILIKNNIHCFSHDLDDVVLTSKNWLWTYPGKPLTKSSIAVLPENCPGWNIIDSKGVCTDYCNKFF